MESPFIKHRNKVLGHYSTASWLRDLSTIPAGDWLRRWRAAYALGVDSP